MGFFKYGVAILKVTAILKMGHLMKKDRYHRVQQLKALQKQVQKQSCQHFRKERCVTDQELYHLYEEFCQKFVPNDSSRRNSVRELLPVNFAGDFVWGKSDSIQVKASKIYKYHNTEQYVVCPTKCGHLGISTLLLQDYLELLQYSLVKYCLAIRVITTTNDSTIIEIIVETTRQSVVRYNRYSVLQYLLQSYRCICTCLSFASSVCVSLSVYGLGCSLYRQSDVNMHGGEYVYI